MESTKGQAFGNGKIRHSLDRARDSCARLRPAEALERRRAGRYA